MLKQKQLHIAEHFVEEWLVIFYPSEHSKWMMFIRDSLIHTDKLGGHGMIAIILKILSFNKN